MTDTNTTVLDKVADTDELEHLVCCEVTTTTEGSVTLCGKPDQWNGEYVDDVSCVVCTKLDEANYCPMRADKKCPWGL